MKLPAADARKAMVIRRPVKGKPPEAGASGPGGEESLPPGQPAEMNAVSEKLTFALHFKKLVNDIHAAPGIEAIQLGLRQRILSLYDAEMATIYLVNTAKREIFSWVVLPGERIKQIRVAINNKSIAGHVAHTGRVVNISNAHDRMELLNIDPDLSFDSNWERKIGIRTRQILSLPILFRNSLMGVIQLVNKKNGSRFTADDQKHLFDLAETLGIAFYNQRKPVRPGSRYEPLIRNGIISEKDFARAEEMATRQGTDLESILRRELKVARHDLGQALSQFYGIPYADLNTSSYSPADLCKGVNIEYFRKTHCIPLTKKRGGTVLFINDPRDQGLIREMGQVLRATDYELCLALKEDVERFIDIHKETLKMKDNRSPEKSFTDILEEMKEQADGVSVSEGVEIEGETPDDRAIVLLVRKIIEDAQRQGASDIHIEPYGNRQDAEVRFRIDGRCSKVLSIPKGHIRAVVSRFKLLANLDISERRRPQDGKIGFKGPAGLRLELRISTVPTAEGNEDVVLRLLPDSEPLPLARIMPAHILARFKEVIGKPYGIVLVVGPTGSGKTTTLHSALAFINTPEKKIWTVEDPVEITQFRLRQVQVNHKIGLTFATAMRAFLRADPDVIMVGEMRDRETVAMGIEASLTGHLVFSTLHTNSASETVARLVDMGMDPFNFADALLGILAQRLVKTLCPACKTAYPPGREEYDHLCRQYGGLFVQRLAVPYGKELRFFKAVGCPECQNTGYRGRMGLYELLTGSDDLKKLIIGRATVEQIRAQAVQEGMSTLLQEGIRQIFLGHTDFSQVTSVCMQ
jgi:type II secretory ATPase GspE/PulE/Tfp pilus assembly ATPase PilB-like protein